MHRYRLDQFFHQNPTLLVVRQSPHAINIELPKNARHLFEAHLKVISGELLGLSEQRLFPRRFDREEKAIFFFLESFRADVACVEEFE